MNTRNSSKSIKNWRNLYVQHPIHPNYHEFYGYYKDLAETVAGTTRIGAFSRSDVTSNRTGFGSEKSFVTSIVSESDSSKASQPDVKPTRKFHDFYQEGSIKVEICTTKIEEPVGSQEADNLFHQLKSLVPNTLAITLLQTSIALVKAGFSESLEVNTVKEEPLIKEETSSQSFVRNKRSFLSLGKNRHIPKLKVIKKKGLFQTKNLLKFEVDNFRRTI